MTKGLDVVDGIAEWIKKQVGPETTNRGESDSTEKGANSDTDTDDEDGPSSEYDSPACCSASGNSDVTVLEP